MNTNKIDLIKAEVERIQLYTQSEVLKQVLDYIDEVQKEPVSEKKCMFTKDSYTDEERKVLCEDCKEKCVYSKKEEPVSIDFEQELYKAFGQVKDFTLGMQIAKWFYDMGKNSQEPISEDLEEAADKYSNTDYNYFDVLVTEYDGTQHLMDDKVFIKDAFKAGADWKEQQFEKNRLAACDKQTEEEAEIEQSFVMGIIENEHRQPTFDDAIKYGMRLQKEQMMANTADAVIGLPYENKDGGYTQLIDVSRPLPVGSNKIAIIFKED